MRELSPWARKSQGREVWRKRYADYIASAAWYRRRMRWAEDELERIRPARIMCLGECGREWRVTRDDTHHSSYARLGNEDHEDLWPLCRACHDLLHHLLDSSKSWRRMDRRLANQQALLVVQDRHRTKQKVQNSRHLRNYL